MEPCNGCPTNDNCHGSDVLEDMNEQALRTAHRLLRRARGRIRTGVANYEYDARMTRWQADRDAWWAAHPDAPRQYGTLPYHAGEHRTSPEYYLWHRETTPELSVERWARSYRPENAPDDFDYEGVVPTDEHIWF